MARYGIWNVYMIFCLQFTDRFKWFEASKGLNETTGCNANKDESENMMTVVIVDYKIGRKVSYGLSFGVCVCALDFQLHSMYSMCGYKLWTMWYNNWWFSLNIVISSKYHYKNDCSLSFRFIIRFDLSRGILDFEHINK